MAKKSLTELKKDLEQIQQAIAAKEERLKMDLGAEVLSQTGVSSLREFKNNYMIVKNNIELEIKTEVKK